ncbi:MAG: flagellar filament capping protein FliD [Deltaproteobacteria bacterium]|nr:flagellar filament capping protein FliD [Deltaproteobacteria bacterium]
MSISLTGIGSGMDLSTLIDRLVDAERAPAAAIERRKLGTNKQLSLLGDLASKLAALEASAKTLDEGRELRAFAATSSDETRVKVSADGRAGVGQYAIAVQSLARTETSESSTFASDTAGIAGTGTLDITVGSGTAVSVAFDANDSLSAIAAKINDSEAAVDAAVLFDGASYRLLITSREAGTAHALSFSETGSSLGLTAPGAERVAAQDAVMTLNGVTVTRSSNHLTDVLSGVTFDLVSTTPTGGAETTVSVTDDPEKLRARLQGFVDAYNAVARALGTQLGAGKGSDPNLTLQGDSMLRLLQGRLSAIVSGSYPGGASTTSLRAFGIKLATDGTLSIDASAFDSLSVADGEALSDLFAGPDAVAARLTALTSEYTAASTGALATKQASLRQRLEGYDDQITRIADRASQVESRLRMQFAALDSLLAQLNSQSSYLMALTKQSSGA